VVVWLAWLFSTLSPTKATIGWVLCKIEKTPHETGRFEMLCRDYSVHNTGSLTGKQIHQHRTLLIFVFSALGFHLIYPGPFVRYA
jgi:hypothetical protein